MSKTKHFEKTDKQREAITLLSGSARNVMLYGGSRSGKTFILCYALAIRAAKEKSRHLVCRLRFNHAKTSLWMDTFPKMFSLCFPDLEIVPQKTDYFFKFPNGSEIWVAGLDDKERTEKILGKEYSTIYFNECSQIQYGSISIALTRLAEQNSLKKKAYYDENPPNKRHWSYYQFILNKNPEDWTDLNADKYACLLMNPEDNKENIDEDYIPEILDQLPEKDRKRFRDGEFEDEDSGFIYYAFDRDKHVKEIQKNKRHRLWIGMDFNINPMTAVVCQCYDNTIYVLDEFWLMGSDTPTIASAIVSKYGPGHNVVPDSTGKRKVSSSSGFSDHDQLRQSGLRVVPTNNPFRIDRYNTVNNLFEKGRIIIDPKCVKLIRDLEQVSYKEGTSLPETNKDSTLTHLSDGLGYLAYYTYPINPVRTAVQTLKR